MFLISLQSSWPVVALRVINSSKELRVWSSFWQLAMKRVSLVFRKTFITVEKHWQENLSSFIISYPDNQKLFRNLAVFDFKSFFVQRKNFSETETTNLIGKHFQFFGSIPSMLVEKPIFLCISNPRDLVESIVDALDGLATQNQTQIKLKILEIGSSLSKIFFLF